MLQLPIGVEADFVGVRRSRRHAGDQVARGDARRPVRHRRDPGRDDGRGEGLPQPAGRDRGRAGRRGARSLSRRRGARRGRPCGSASARARSARAFVPVLCGSAFKNKGVQPLLDAVVDYLPAPTDVAAIKGVKMGTNEPVMRHSSDDEPFAGLAFKIMSDPFVGSLTFVRIYSGVVAERQPGAEHGQEQPRAGRPHAADARQPPRGHQGGARRRHRRVRRAQEHDHRRHAVRPGRPGRPRAHGVPRAGHRDRGRAQDQGRPGKDGPGAWRGSRPRTPRSGSPSITRAARP